MPCCRSLGRPMQRTPTGSGSRYYRGDPHSRPGSLRKAVGSCRRHTNGSHRLYILYSIYTLYSVEEYGFEKPVMPCLSAAGGAPAYFGRPVVALDQPNPIQPDLHTCLSIITKVNIVKKNKHISMKNTTKCIKQQRFTSRWRLIANCCINSVSCALYITKYMCIDVTACMVCIWKENLDVVFVFALSTVFDFIYIVHFVLLCCTCCVINE